MAPILKELKGDLFTSTDSTDALAHCISEDCRMGKGIAVIFKQKFGGVDDLLRQVSEGATTGKTAYLESDNRFVYYLITKKRVYAKPTYPHLRSSLESLREHAVANKVQRICMPRIGCGLDALSWGMVRAMLLDVFAETDIELNVYSLDR